MLIHAIAGGSPNPNSVHLTIWIVSLTSQNRTPLSRFPCCLFHINRHFVNRRGTSSSLKFLHVVLGTRILSANKMPIYPKIHLSNFLTICIGPERWRGHKPLTARMGRGVKFFLGSNFQRFGKGKYLSRINDKTWGGKNANYAIIQRYYIFWLSPCTSEKLTGTCFNNLFKSP